MMATTLRVGNRFNLSEIEDLISKAANLGADPLTIWLPRTTGTGLFVDSRIAALLATAAYCRNLTIVDWADAETPNWEGRFSRDTPGLAALAYGSEILTAQKSALASHRLRDALSTGEGRTENQADGRSVYFAFDTEIRQQPLSLASARNRDDFRLELISRFNTAFNKSGQRAGSHPDLFRSDSEVEVADFIYELFENGFQHGSLSDSNEVIPGLRFLQVRRHIANSDSELLARADGFSELQEFFKASLTQQRGRRYFEIAVSDQGLGIVDRFLATRGDLRALYAAPAARADLVNDIVNRALSSKLNQPGAGHGLRKVLSAVQRLAGFVSLRTGPYWLYSDFTKLLSGSPLRLSHVRTSTAPAHVRGTHFNVLVRLL